MSDLSDAQKIEVLDHAVNKLVAENSQLFKINLRLMQALRDAGVSEWVVTAIAYAEPSPLDTD